MSEKPKPRGEMFLENKSEKMSLGEYLGTHKIIAIPGDFLEDKLNELDENLAKAEKTTGNQKHDPLEDQERFLSGHENKKNTELLQNIRAINKLEPRSYFYKVKGDKVEITCIDDKRNIVKVIIEPNEIAEVAEKIKKTGMAPALILYNLLEKSGFQYNNTLNYLLGNVNEAYQKTLEETTKTTSKKEFSF